MYGGIFHGIGHSDMNNEMMSVLATLGAGDISLRDCMNIWYSIVEQYCDRSLTRATDILIAISGIAEEIRRQKGYDYVHGLWKQDWCKGLVWTRRPGGVPTGAPSWTWASVGHTFSIRHGYFVRIQRFAEAPEIVFW